MMSGVKQDSFSVLKPLDDVLKEKTKAERAAKASAMATAKAETAAARKEEARIKAGQRR